MAAEPLAGQPLEVLVEVLATATGQLAGLEGAALAKHVAELTRQVDQLARAVEERVVVDDQREVAAAEVERLIDVFARTGTAAGNLIGKHREAIAKAFRGADLDRVAAGLRLLADWMQNPTSRSETEIEQLIAQLPANDDEARRAAIAADVKASLDEIFRGTRKAT